MARYRQHQQFSSHRSAQLIFKLRRQRFRKMLSMADDVELMRASWVLDRAVDPSFKIPIGYDYPEKYLRAGIDEPGRIWPWELETLLIEALGTPKNPGNRSANPRAWSFWAEIVSALRSAENAEGGNRPRGPILRHLNRILYRQVQWQARQQNLADFVRWKSIFSDPSLSDLYVTKNGMCPLKFQMIGLGLSSILDESQETTISYEYESKQFRSDEIRTFIKMASRTITQIREDCHSVVMRSELAHRESPLRRFPLIKISDNPTRLISPLRQPLFWRITEGMYYDVVSIPASRNLIGSGFEIFQRRLISTAYKDYNVSGDISYGPIRLNRRSPDVTITQDNNLEIAFECKAKKIPLVDKISIEHDLANSIAVSEIAKGVFQLARFRHDLRSGIVEGMQETEHSQYVILTLDEWNFVGPITKDAAFLKAAEMLDRQRININFDLREITFCTAGDLDLFVTRLPLGRLRELFAKNRQPQFREHAPNSLAAEFYEKPAKWRDYPLASEFVFDI
ncbi:hypothetical protein [Bosea sp. RAC05]|uniref:hypothetical protein n=1 Tax=Bosea sp. RAC05 TaxID=1842539 RepID=UPI00085657C0|nr:hypothetical protein [Bosea sp. RAC05]AOG07552.1 hypothetical protein BSY19_3049 [Bosea sp. RAC05]